MVPKLFQESFHYDGTTVSPELYSSRLMPPLSCTVPMMTIPARAPGTLAADHGLPASSSHYDEELDPLPGPSPDHVLHLQDDEDDWWTTPWWQWPNDSNWNAAGEWNQAVWGSSLWHNEKGDWQFDDYWQWRPEDGYEHPSGWTAMAWYAVAVGVLLASWYASTP